MREVCLEIEKVITLPAVQIDNSLTLKEYINAGNYDYIESYINVDNFPSNCYKSKELLPIAVSFKGKPLFIHVEQIVAQLNEIGLRPGTFHELLTIGATCYKDLGDYLLVALGSPCRVWKKSGDWKATYYPAIQFKSFSKELRLFLPRSDDQTLQFLAFKKEK